MCGGYVYCHSEYTYSCFVCVCVWGCVWDVHTPLPPFACVGKSHDQSVGLPRGLDPEKTAFGLSTIKGTYIDTHTSHTHTGGVFHILTQDVICCAVLNTFR